LLHTVPQGVEVALELDHDLLDGPVAAAIFERLAESGEAFWQGGPTGEVIVPLLELP
jgi:hypothetical protein